jgi:hypothetical protein
VRAGYADLHLHTTASDGTQSIPELAKRAAASGLCSIAITDHDTISCDLTQRVTRIGGLEVITGVEIKVDFDGIPGELLGYFIDPRAQAMTDLFSFMKEERERRMAEMVERCQELLDLDISVAEVRALAGGSIGRPHLAQILVEKGTAVSMRDAFDRFIARGQPCYVSLARLGFREAARAVHGAGGVASLPHPCFMDVPDWERFLTRIHAEGVDGIEVFYPYRSAAGTLHISPEMLMSLAKEKGFLLTGGSDDHGPHSVKETLGSVRVAYEHVVAMKRVCGLA